MAARARIGTVSWRWVLVGGGTAVLPLSLVKTLLKSSPTQQPNTTNTAAIDPITTPREALPSVSCFVDAIS
ncbi:hypothetical protein GCM10012279_19930 [Micromonospora yangpuensis]|nr:hypothetical protein GCM10012279_19930 [Micromonospora yangpuensis]